MLHRLILAAALAAGLSSAARAQTAFVVQSCASTGVNTPVGPGGVLVRDAAGNLCVSGGASGGASSATASPTGGLTTYRVNSASGTNATSVKGAPGRLYAYTLCNTAGAARYVRFFDLATAPTPGVSPVAAGAIAVSAGSCQTFTNGIGLSFVNGIAYDITGAAGDADTTAVTAGDVAGFLGFQ